MKNSHFLLLVLFMAALTAALFYVVSLWKKEKVEREKLGFSLAGVINTNEQLALENRKLQGLSVSS